MVYVTQVHEQ